MCSLEGGSAVRLRAALRFCELNVTILRPLPALDRGPGKLVFFYFIMIILRLCSKLPAIRL